MGPPATLGAPVSYGDRVGDAGTGDGAVPPTAGVGRCGCGLRLAVILMVGSSLLSDRGCVGVGLVGGAPERDGCGVAGAAGASLAGEDCAGGDDDGVCAKASAPSDGIKNDVDARKYARNDMNHPRTGRTKHDRRLSKV